MSTFQKFAIALVTACVVTPLLAQSTMVQIGFLKSYDYPFVLDNPNAATQIIENLPPAIAYGLSLDASSVVFEELGEYDTASSLGYNTTLAYLNIPSDVVEELQLGLRTPSSRFYSNPVAVEAELMDEVNTAIPVYPAIPPTGVIISS